MTSSTSVPSSPRNQLSISESQRLQTGILEILRELRPGTEPYILLLGQAGNPSLGAYAQDTSEVPAHAIADTALAMTMATSQASPPISTSATSKDMHTTVETTASNVSDTTSPSTTDEGSAGIRSIDLSTGPSEPVTTTATDCDGVADPSRTLVTETGASSIPNPQLTPSQSITPVDSSDAQPVSGIQEAESHASIRSFTYFGELRAAQTDADFERIQARILAEWQLCLGALLPILAFDGAVFGFSSAGTVFSASTGATHLIALSALVAMLGLLVLSSLIFTCAYAKVQHFKDQTLGMHSNYLWFALQSRFPLFTVLLSLFMTSIFVYNVASSASPAAARVFLALGCVMFSLEYLALLLRIVKWIVTDIVMYSLNGIKKEAPSWVVAFASRFTQYDILRGAGTDGDLENVLLVWKSKWQLTAYGLGCVIVPDVLLFAVAAAANTLDDSVYDIFWLITAVMSFLALLLAILLITKSDVESFKKSPAFFHPLLCAYIACTPSAIFKVSLFGRAVGGLVAGILFGSIFEMIYGVISVIILAFYFRMTRMAAMVIGRWIVKASVSVKGVGLWVSGIIRSRSRGRNESIPDVGDDSPSADSSGPQVFTLALVEEGRGRRMNGAAGEDGKSGCALDESRDSEGGGEGRGEGGSGIIGEVLSEDRGERERLMTYFDLQETAPVTL